VADDFDDDLGCVSTCAMLLVSGDNIDAEEFTKLFQLTPTEIAKAGTCSGWRISSAGKLESKSAEQHIDWILHQLEGKREIIENLKGRGCQVDLYCQWQGREGSDLGPYLRSNLLKKVSDLNLNLIFGFHR